jgi:hypothetical protein
MGHWIILVGVALASFGVPTATAQTGYGGDGQTAARSAEVQRFECVSSELVEVTVSSKDPFLVRDALLELQIGPVASSMSRYPDGGDLHTVVFGLTREQLADISAPDDIASVRFEPGAPGDVWAIGPLDPASVEGCEAEDGSGA